MSDMTCSPRLLEVQSLQWIWALINRRILGFFSFEKVGKTQKYPQELGFRESNCSPLDATHRWWTSLGFAPFEFYNPFHVMCFMIISKSSLSQP